MSSSMEIVYKFSFIYLKQNPFFEIMFYRNRVSRSSNKAVIGCLSETTNPYIRN